MVLGLLATAAVISACAHPAPPAATEPPIGAPPAAQPAPEEEGVRQAYERFWEVSQAVPHHPPAQQRRELSEIAVEPLAERMAGNLAAQRAKGITLYGAIIPRISGIRIDGDTAVVTDCQDTSRSGQADASGRPRTVGVARNPVTTTLHREASGAWKAAEITYPSGSC